MSGLEGETIADTQKSRVDGQAGELIYHGYSILDLGENADFEEVAYLLWNNAYPNAEQLAEFDAELKSLRALP